MNNALENTDLSAADPANDGQRVQELAQALLQSQLNTGVVNNPPVAQTGLAPANGTQVTSGDAPRSPLRMSQRTDFTPAVNARVVRAESGQPNAEHAPDYEMQGPILHALAFSDDNKTKCSFQLDSDVKKYVDEEFEKSLLKEFMREPVRQHEFKESLKNLLAHNTGACLYHRMVFEDDIFNLNMSKVYNTVADDNGHPPKTELPPAYLTGQSSFNVLAKPNVIPKFVYEPTSSGPYMGSKEPPTDTDTLLADIGVDQGGDIIQKACNFLVAHNNPFLAVHLRLVAHGLMLRTFELTHARAAILKAKVCAQTCLARLEPLLQSSADKADIAVVVSALFDYLREGSQPGTLPTDVPLVDTNVASPSSAALQTQPVSSAPTVQPTESLAVYAKRLKMPEFRPSKSPDLVNKALTVLSHTTAIDTYATLTLPNLAIEQVITLTLLTCGGPHHTWAVSLMERLGGANAHPIKTTKELAKHMLAKYAPGNLEQYTNELITKLRLDSFKTPLAYIDHVSQLRMLHDTVSSTPWHDSFMVPMAHNHMRGSKYYQYACLNDGEQVETFTEIKERLLKRYHVVSSTYTLADTPKPKDNTMSNGHRNGKPHSTNKSLRDVQGSVDQSGPKEGASGGPARGHSGSRQAGHQGGHTNSTSRDPRRNRELHNTQRGGVQKNNRGPKRNSGRWNNNNNRNDREAAFLAAVNSAKDDLRAEMHAILETRRSDPRD